MRRGQFLTVKHKQSHSVNRGRESGRTSKFPGLAGNVQNSSSGGLRAPFSKLLAVPALEESQEPGGGPRWNLWAVWNQTKYHRSALLPADYKGSMMASAHPPTRPQTHLFPWETVIRGCTVFLRGMIQLFSCRNTAIGRNALCTQRPISRFPAGK